MIYFSLKGCRKFLGRYLYALSYILPFLLFPSKTEAVKYVLHEKKLPEEIQLLANYCKKADLEKWFIFYKDKDSENAVYIPNISNAFMYLNPESKELLYSESGIDNSTDDENISISLSDLSPSSAYQIIDGHAEAIISSDTVNSQPVQQSNDNSLGFNISTAKFIFSNKILPENLLSLENKMQKFIGKIWFIPYGSGQTSTVFVPQHCFTNIYHSSNNVLFSADYDSPGHVVHFETLLTGQVYILIENNGQYSVQPFNPDSEKMPDNAVSVVSNADNAIPAVPSVTDHSEASQTLLSPSLTPTLQVSEGDTMGVFRLNQARFTVSFNNKKNDIAKLSNVFALKVKMSQFKNKIWFIPFMDDQISRVFIPPHCFEYLYFLSDNLVFSTGESTEHSVIYSGITPEVVYILILSNGQYSVQAFDPDSDIMPDNAVSIGDSDDDKNEDEILPKLSDTEHTEHSSPLKIITNPDNLSDDFKAIIDTANQNHELKTLYWFAPVMINDQIHVFIPEEIQAFFYINENGELVFNQHYPTVVNVDSFSVGHIVVQQGYDNQVNFQPHALVIPSDSDSIHQSCDNYVENTKEDKINETPEEQVQAQTQTCFDIKSSQAEPHQLSKITEQSKVTAQQGSFSKPPIEMPHLLSAPDTSAFVGATICGQASVDPIPAHQAFVSRSTPEPSKREGQPKTSVTAIRYPVWLRSHWAEILAALGATFSAVALKIIAEAISSPSKPNKKEQERWTDHHFDDACKALTAPQLRSLCKQVRTISDARTFELEKRLLLSIDKTSNTRFTMFGYSYQIRLEKGWLPCHRIDQENLHQVLTKTPEAVMIRFSGEMSVELFDDNNVAQMAVTIDSLMKALVSMNNRALNEKHFLTPEFLRIFYGIGALYAQNSSSCLNLAGSVRGNLFGLSALMEKLIDVLWEKKELNNEHSLWQELYSLSLQARADRSGFKLVPVFKLKSIAGNFKLFWDSRVQIIDPKEGTKSWLSAGVSQCHKTGRPSLDAQIYTEKKELQVSCDNLMDCYKGDISINEHGFILQSIPSSSVFFIEEQGSNTKIPVVFRDGRSVTPVWYDKSHYPEIHILSSHCR